MTKVGDLCWANAGGGVSWKWPCKVIDSTNAPLHVVDARPIGGRNSVLVSYTFKGTVAWGWLQRKNLSPFNPKGENSSDLVPGAMQRALHKARVKDIVMAQSYEPPLYATCWLADEGPVSMTEVARVDTSFVIKSLKKSAVQESERRAEQAIGKGAFLLLSSYRGFASELKARGEEMQLQQAKELFAGPSHRSKDKKAVVRETAPILKKKKSWGGKSSEIAPKSPQGMSPPSAEKAGPSFEQSGQGTKQAGNDKEKLRDLLRELKQAATTYPASSAELTLLFGGSKDCLSVYRLREASKG